jgi:hypothetical protein
MKVNMWNPKTRRVMYRLLKRHSIPAYKSWKGVMSPSLPGLIGSDYDHALKKVAHDMNLLCGKFLRPGKTYKHTSVKQQLNFTLQQGVRAKGYQHRFGGQRDSCFDNLQAAIAEGFIAFEEVHASMHPFIVSVSSGLAMPDVEKEMINKMPEEQAKEAQMALELEVPPVLDDLVIFSEPMVSKLDSKEEKMKEFIDAIRPIVSWHKGSIHRGHVLNHAPFAALWESSSSAEELEEKYNAIIQDTVRQLKTYGVRQKDFKPYSWKYFKTKAARTAGCEREIEPPQADARTQKKNRFQQLISAEPTWATQSGLLVKVKEERDFWRSLGTAS